MRQTPAPPGTRQPSCAARSALAQCWESLAAAAGLPATWAGVEGGRSGPGRRRPPRAAAAPDPAREMRAAMMTKVPRPSLMRKCCACAEHPAVI